MHRCRQLAAALFARLDCRMYRVADIPVRHAMSSRTASLPGWVR
jgi:hypothetical protein